MNPPVTPNYRVAIRRCKAGDGPVLKRSLPEALAAAQGSRTPREDRLRDVWSQQPGAGRSVAVFQFPESDSPIGIAAWQCDGSRTTAVIRLVALWPPFRGWGLGTEGIYLLESFTGAQRMAVPIPPGNGLAVYFWLRLGYRPLLAVEQDPFMRQEGGMWMARTMAR